jgi:hypothetical protein
LKLLGDVCHIDRVIATITTLAADRRSHIGASSHAINESSTLFGEEMSCLERERGKEDYVSIAPLLSLPLLDSPYITIGGNDTARVARAYVYLRK